ncbi:MAG: apolipoprotein N-acyltransferase [Bacteroidota bacterium]
MSKTNLKRILLPISTLVMLLTAYRMFQLYQLDRLWGHLPLSLFLSGWLTILLIWEPRFSKQADKMKLFAGASWSAVLLSLGFPTLPFTFLMFVGFVPLLWVEQQLSTRSEAPAKWEVFKYSYHTFVVWNILTTYWVANTLFVAGVVAVMVNALLMSIPFVLFHQTKKMLNPKLGYLGFVAYWVSFEYIHLRWEISWPWLTLGNSFAEFPSWVQWYEYTGVFGGSLWILLANVLIFQSWQNYRSGKGFGKRGWQAAAWIIIPLVLSLVMYFTYENRGKSVEVVSVQPNFEPHYQKFTVRRKDILDQFISLSESQLTPETDYLLFPETSFGRIKIKDVVNSSNAMQALKAMVDRYPKLKLVSGISAQHIYEPGEPHSPAVRMHVRKTDTLYWESYNAAVQLSSGQPDVPYYFKSILVPGAEFFPYRNILFFIKPLVDGLGGSFSGLGKQKERTAFFAEDGSGVAPVICYESIYGEYATGYVRKGANALFIVTNDGWWDNTAGHRQHMAFATLRAIETRRSIARSANTGTSAFVNQRGDITQATQYEEAIAIRGQIQLNDRLTFYVLWGDLIGRLLGFTAILLLLNTFVKARLPKDQQR